MKKKIFSMAVAAALSIGTLNAYQINLKKGWNLKGALTDINVKEFNNSDIISIWAYDGKTPWKVYLPNNPNIMNNLPQKIQPLNIIHKGEGYWVLSKNNIAIDVGNESASQQSQSQTQNCQVIDPTTGNISSANSVFDKYLVTPSNIELSDIAGKNIILYVNGNKINTTMNSNGIAHIVFPNGKEQVAKLENGAINIYQDNNYMFSFKKIAIDKNGIVLVAYDKNDINNIEHTWIETWLFTEPTPKDITSKLPYTAWRANTSSWYRKIESNLTATDYYYDTDSNSYKPGNQYQLRNEDNKLIRETNLTYETENYQESHIKSYQLIGSIGDYDIFKTEHVYIRKYHDSNLTGKSWDYIINNNIKVFGYNLNNDGTVSTDYNSSDENITYAINGDVAILTFTHCDEHDNSCDSWESNLTLNNNTGEISETENGIDTEVISSNPIVKITKCGDEPLYRKRVSKEKVLKRFKKRW